MAYTINLTNGDTKATILDGSIDTSSTDITLIGRNYTGFGEYLNENLIKILENFASITPPTKPLLGQIWFNSLTSAIEVYTISGWRSASGPIVSDTQPLNLTTGDLWIDSREDQLYFYDGTNLILVGPTWGKSQGITGFVAEKVFDDLGNPKSILIQYINDNIYSILSNNAFTPSPAITGFTSIQVGFQISSAYSSNFYATVSNSTKFDGLTSDQYMRLDRNQVTTGILSLLNNGGLIFGSRSVGTLYVPDATNQVSLKNNTNGGILTLQTTDNTGAVNNAVYVDGAQNRIGIFNNFPLVELDINGTTNTTNLTVDTSATISGLTLSTNYISSASDIHLSPSVTGNIVLSNSPKITGLAAPTASNDATNKIYVDNNIKSSTLSLTFVDNGLEADINGSILLLLNDIANPTEYYTGRIAYVHVQHIDFTNRAVARSLKKFQISGSAWQFVSNLTSSI
jgi:hypothetical protein